MRLRLFETPKLLINKKLFLLSASEIKNKEHDICRVLINILDIFEEFIITS